MDLLKLNVAPLAVFQMLKSMRAGQRVASDSQDPTAVPLPAPSVPETRGQSRAGAAGGQRLALGAFGPEWPGLCCSCPRTRWAHPMAGPLDSNPQLGLCYLPPWRVPVHMGRVQGGSPKAT